MFTLLLGLLLAFNGCVFITVFLKLRENDARETLEDSPSNIILFVLLAGKVAKLLGVNDPYRRASLVGGIVLVPTSLVLIVIGLGEVMA
ncbi:MULTISPECIES: hypothetical protein [Lacticaseibacillus]|uniref:hypothetical protein n=1 Tax=Lacticaseibacillus TaxID=2759736 RepID=UPI0004695804|nr:hypothetical protein [Lacticaseibacillus casei]MBI6596992.1 hypothetical protein [Lacticaseibacillus casei]MBO1480746.1 hypothetical protein [Lacticaseibacillus casei]MBO2415968.1 hypothetical protein [Lacticaseibacillus casei]MCK2080421.1 hypothetical protein [Lacticaseibacillus casei]MDZ5496625.1 hypothetical protein [Lacticaseibacillus casei]